MSGLLEHAIKLPIINWNFVMLGGHLQKVSDNWLYPRERHLIYELIYVVSGIEKIEWDDFTTEINEGEFVIISPGMYHTVSAVKNLTYFCFHFDINEPVFEEQLIANPHLLFRKNEPDPEQIIPLLNKMIDLLSPAEEYNFSDKISLQIILSKVLVGLYNATKKMHTTNNVYSMQYAKLIKDNLRSEATEVINYNLEHVDSSEKQRSMNIIQPICRKLSLSSGYVSRIYKQYFGDSPKTFVNHLKIQNAKRLLVKPQLNINQVSFALGYKNPANFSRQFKKYTEMSPKEYRLSKVSQIYDKELYKENFKKLYEYAERDPDHAWELF